MGNAGELPLVLTGPEAIKLARWGRDTGYLRLAELRDSGAVPGVRLEHGRWRVPAAPFVEWLTTGSAQ